MEEERDQAAEETESNPAVSEGVEEVVEGEGSEGGAAGEEGGTKTAEPPTSEKVPAGFTAEGWHAMSDADRKQVRELLKGFTQTTQRLSQQDKVIQVYSQFDHLLQSNPSLRADVEQTLRKHLSPGISEEEEGEEEDKETSEELLDEEVDPQLKPVVKELRDLRKRVEVSEKQANQSAAAMAQQRAQEELEQLKKSHKENFDAELSNEDVVGLLNDAIVNKTTLSRAYRDRFFDHAVKMSRLTAADQQKAEGKKNLGTVSARKAGSGGVPSHVKVTPEEIEMARHFGHTAEDIAQWKGRTFISD